jgi:hypothetical protein
MCDVYEYSGRKYVVHITEQASNVETQLKLYKQAASSRRRRSTVLELKATHRLYAYYDT